MDAVDMEKAALIGEGDGARLFVPLRRHPTRACKCPRPIRTRRSWRRGALRRRGRGSSAREIGASSHRQPALDPRHDRRPRALSRDHRTALGRWRPPEPLGPESSRGLGVPARSWRRFERHGGPRWRGSCSPWGPRPRWVPLHGRGVIRLVVSKTAVFGDVPPGNTETKRGARRRPVSSCFCCVLARR